MCTLGCVTIHCWWLSQYCFGNCSTRANAGHLLSIYLFVAYEIIIESKLDPIDMF